MGRPHEHAVKKQGPQRHLVEAIAELEARIHKLLTKRPTHPANRRLLKHLRNERPAMLTFLADPAVDATNWRSEQAVRPAVANRPPRHAPHRQPRAVRH